MFSRAPSLRRATAPKRQRAESDRRRHRGEEDDRDGLTTVSRLHDSTAASSDEIRMFIHQQLAALTPPQTSLSMAHSCAPNPGSTRFRHLSCRLSGAAAGVVAPQAPAADEREPRRPYLSMQPAPARLLCARRANRALRGRAETIRSHRARVHSVPSQRDGANPRAPMPVEGSEAPQRLPRRHPGPSRFRGSMAGLHSPPADASPSPRGRRCTALGPSGSLPPSSWRIPTARCAPASPAHK